MANPTFEYCSLNYLNQWFNYDQQYCDALAGHDRDKKLSAMKKAGSFYGVARTLHLKFDENKFEKKGRLKRYEPVLEILDSLEPSQFRDAPVGEIKRVEKQISRKYGDSSVLSATTKFLWLKIQRPILIYDRRARNALRVEEGDLESFYREWRKGFKHNESRIIQACAKLPEMNKYSINQEVTKQEIKKLSSKAWFHERVYDTYLWHSGT